MKGSHLRRQHRPPATSAIINKTSDEASGTLSPLSALVPLPLPV
jgi:hypothetical protein